MEFSEVMAAFEVAEGGGGGIVPGDWMQGRTAFGGLLAAFANKAMRTLVPAGLPLRQLQVTFIGPAAEGPVSVEARLLRVGRAVAQAECKVSSGGQPVTTAVGLYGAPRTSSVAVEIPRRPVPDLASARKWPFVAGATPVFTRHIDQRWAEGALPFGAGEHPCARILLRHEDPAPLTEAHVIALADAIPTPGLSVLERPAPVSSLTWTLEFLQHDLGFAPARWWHMDAEVIAGGEGYLHHAATLFDPDGRAFALNWQLVVIYDQLP